MKGIIHDPRRRSPLLCGGGYVVNNFWRGPRTKKEVVELLKTVKKLLKTVEFSEFSNVISNVVPKVFCENRYKTVKNRPICI